MELLVQIIYLDGTPAHLADFGVFLVNLQKLYITVYRAEVFVVEPVERRLAVENVTGEVKIAPVELHQGFCFPDVAGGRRLVPEGVEEIDDLQHVNTDIRPALPAVIALP